MHVFRSEWYRLIRGKMLPISIGLMGLLTALNFLIMRLVIHLNLEGASELSRQMMGTTGTDYLRTSMAQGLSGGTVYIILSVIVANLMTEELKDGTLKYTLLVRDRVALYGGKLLTLLSIAVLMAATIGLVNLAVAILGFKGGPGEPAVFNWALEVGMAAQAFAGFSALLLLLFTRIQHMGAAIGLGVALYIGMSLFELLLPDGPAMVLFTRVATWFAQGAYTAITLQSMAYILGFGAWGLWQFKRREITG